MLNFIFGVLIVVAVFLVVRKIQNNSPEAKQAKLTGEEFLAKNQQEEGVNNTDSGLQYKVLNIGEGIEHPQASDTVLVHYHGMLVNGDVFDSSVNRGEPISFGLNQVIKGWTEGLQLMVVGEKTRLFIPSELAYGARAAGTIPPHSALIFDVELLAINP